MGNEIHATIYLFVFFQGSFVIDEGYYDFSFFWDVGFSDEDEISVIDSFLVHGVSLCSEKKIFIICSEEFGRDGYLGLDVFLCEDRHTTGDSSYERDPTHFIAICSILWRYTELVVAVSIEPSLCHDLIQHDGYRSRRSIPESCLESSYSELFSFCGELSDFLEDELFFLGEFFHKIKVNIYTVYKRVYMYTF